MSVAAALAPLCLLFFELGVEAEFQPTWVSLDSRKVPVWWTDAKLGVFMHWGLYSVPSFDESAWMWGHIMMGYPRPIKFMKDNYRPSFKYQDFANEFHAEFFNASVFAEIVRNAGAKYFVFTSKHHEGYCMWPSKTTWNWNSVDTGPHRDIVGELEAAFRKEAPEVAFGLYFSLLDWAHPYYLSDKNSSFSKKQYPPVVSTPQMHEIVTRYKPDIVWGDGNWEASSDYWDSKQFLAWLFNDSPVKDNVVINDRFGNETMCHHGQPYTCHDKYTATKLPKYKWENCMMIDKGAWGYRRNHRLAEFYTSKELIKLLMSTISYGGNLLMDVGPTSDGQIIPIFEDRLLQMGKWLQANGEAVYGTKPWVYQNDSSTPNVWYTSTLRKPPTNPYRLYNNQTENNTIVYATFSEWPESHALQLGRPRLTPQAKVQILGYGSTGLRFKAMGAAKGVIIDLSGVNWVKLPSTEVWVIKMEYLADDAHDPFDES